MQRIRRSRSLSTLVVALLVAAPGMLRAATPTCVSTAQTFFATGALQTYSVPANTKALLITADGASGGRGMISGFFTAASFGAHIQAGIPVTGASILDVVVGSAGGDGSGVAGGGGGGGGSFVFTPAGISLVVAGAGGGAEPISNIGGSAQLTPGGADGGGNSGGAGGTGGSGGGASTSIIVNGGGGGGFVGTGGDGSGLGSGGGGHRVSAPGDAAGGAGGSGSRDAGGSGGFGGGGGAGSGGGGGGGGGGGYGGGGGGGGGGRAPIGGGGGSFVAAGGTTYASSVLTTTGDGSVTICATAIGAPPTIAKAFGPTTIETGGTSTVTLTLSNPNASASTNASFTDPLANMSAAGGAVGGSCLGAAPSTLSAGSTALSFSGITIPANGSCTVTFAVTSSIAGVQPNQTSGVITTQTPSAGTVSNSANLTVLAAPTIAKAFGPASIQMGSNSNVTLTLSNPNASALTSASFTDPLANMSAAGGAVGGSCVGTTPSTLSAGATVLSFAGITIPATGSCTVTFAVTSNIPGVQPNQTSGLTTTQTPAAGTVSNSANLTVLAAPTIAKAFGPASIQMGSSSTVTLTLSNPNTSALTNASFTDPLANMSAAGGAVGGSCVGAAPRTLSAGSTAVSFSGITIPATGSCTVTFVVTSNIAGVQPNQTSGVTTAQTPSAGTLSNSANLIVFATPTVAKAFGATTIQSGGISTVTLTLSNPNASVLTSASFTDPLANMSAAGGAVGGSCVGTTPSTLSAGATVLSFTGITIPATGSCTVTFVATSNIPGVQPNQTSGLTTTQTPAAGIVSNSANLTVLAAPTIAKAFGPASIQMGSSSTVTLTLSNPNTSALTNASFTDPLANMSAAGGAVGGSCVGAAPSMLSAGSTAVSFSGITIPATGSCTVTFAVTSSIAGVQPNQTSGVITTQTPSAGTVSNSANLTVLAAPTIAKAFGPASIQMGSNSTVTLTLSNPNTSALTNASLTDPLANMSAAGGAVGGSCVGAAPSTLSAGSTALSFSGITIPPAGSCTVTFAVTSSIAGVQPNQTSGVTTAQTPSAGTLSNSANLIVFATPTVAKAFGATTIQSGGISTVTLTLSNPNASALTSASFTDPLANMSAAGGAVGGSCVGTTPSTLSAGATVLSFSGITIPATGSCTVTFVATSNIPGVQPNQTSGLTTTQTPAVGTASNSANLTVLAAPTIIPGPSRPLLLLLAGVLLLVGLAKVTRRKVPC